MPSSTPTLLLTSSVFVSAPFVGLSDPKERAELTLASIKQWIDIAGDLNIVICDGSGYDFTKDVAERFPQAKIECISFKNSAKLVADYGKGYGEGEIINYALEHSEFLRNSDYFVKCTSKLWVKNFPAIFNRWNNVFQCQFGLEKPKSIRRALPHIVDTRFYIIRKSYYRDHFSGAYKNVRDREGYYLENSFRDVVVGDRLRASSILFPIPPLIEGVAGTSGNAYKTISPMKGRLKNLKTYVRLRLYEKFFKPAAS
jgi:hypothetical protein